MASLAGLQQEFACQTRQQCLPSFSGRPLSSTPTYSSRPTRPSTSSCRAASTSDLVTQEQLAPTAAVIRGASFTVWLSARVFCIQAGSCTPVVPP